MLISQSHYNIRRRKNKIIQWPREAERLQKNNLILLFYGKNEIFVCNKITFSNNLLFVRFVKRNLYK